VEDPTPSTYTDSSGKTHETFDIRGIGPKRFLSAAFHTMNNIASFYVGIDNNTMVILQGDTKQVVTYLDFIAHYHRNRDTLSDIYGGTKVTLMNKIDAGSRSIYKFIFIKPGLLSDVLYDPLLKQFKEDVDWLYRAFEFLTIIGRGGHPSKTNDFVITKYAPLPPRLAAPDEGGSVPEDYYRYLFYYHRTVQAMGVHLKSSQAGTLPVEGVEKGLLNSIIGPLGIDPKTEDGVYMLNLILPKNKSPQHGLSLDDLGLLSKAHPPIEQISTLSDTILYYETYGSESDENIVVINELEPGPGRPLAVQLHPSGLKDGESEGTLGTYDNMNLRLAICYNAFVGKYCGDQEVDCGEYRVSSASRTSDVTLQLVNTHSGGWVDCEIQQV